MYIVQCIVYIRSFLCGKMVLKFAFVIVLMGRICESIVGQESDYCYADDANPYRYFASKTAYDLVRVAKMQILNSECKAQHVWALIRHGTRFTTSDGDWDNAKLTKFRDEVIANVDGNEKR